MYPVGGFRDGVVCAGLFLDVNIQLTENGGHKDAGTPRAAAATLEA